MSRLQLHQVSKIMLTPRLEVLIGGHFLTVLSLTTGIDAVTSDLVCFDAPLKPEDGSPVYYLDEIEQEIFVDLGDPIDRLILSLRATELGLTLLARALPEGGLMHVAALLDEQRAGVGK
jgi:hypothetical protein